MNTFLTFLFLNYNLLSLCFAFLSSKIGNSSPFSDQAVCDEGYRSYSEKNAFGVSTRALPCGDIMEESYDEEGPMKFERETAEATAALSPSQKVIPQRQPLSNFDLSNMVSPNAKNGSPLGLDHREHLHPADAMDWRLSSGHSSPQSISAKGGQSISERLFASSSQKNIARIGSTWSVAIQCFKLSGSVFECIGHLRHICDILDEVDRKDRVKYCKSDFDNAVSVVKKSSTLIVTDELLQELIHISKKYFNQNSLRRMPLDMMFEIFGRLGLDEFSVYSSTCKEWSLLASRDEVWKRLYHQRFTKSNPTSMPRAQKGFKEQYKARMEDPELGDKVEVAWRGKFRLEARDVYQGLAWWVAEVVDKHTEVGKYKIRYPGWESRWDEWVPRTRLRWAVEKNTLCAIRSGDVVELWCCGANVPGAWLESRVKKVRDGRFCVNRVLTTGTTSHSRPLWADRARLRLVRHPQGPNDDNLKDCSSGSEEYERGTGRARSRLGQLMSYVGNMMGGNAAAGTPIAPVDTLMTAGAITNANAAADANADQETE